MHKALHLRDNINHTFQEKEKEDSQIFKVALMHLYKNSKNTQKKEQRKTNYGDQHKQHNDQHNNKSRETEMGRKIIIQIFLTTNRGGLTWEDLDMAKKGKP